MLATLGLFAAGGLAGAMNALAGGGSFVCFPVLVYAGLPPVVANASSTVALFPGGLTSVWAFRHDIFPEFAGVRLWPLILASAAGGFLGALLLLVTPQRTFDLVIPWILLLATLTFAFGRQLGVLAAQRLHAGPTTILAMQVVLGVYGGYFGGAVGILMMAAWTVTTRVDVKTMNPHRALLVNAANSVAVLCFIIGWAGGLARDLRDPLRHDPGRLWRRPGGATDEPRRYPAPGHRGEFAGDGRLLRAPVIARRPTSFRAAACLPSGSGSAPSRPPWPAAAVA